MSPSGFHEEKERTVNKKSVVSLFVLFAALLLLINPAGATSSSPPELFYGEDGMSCPVDLAKPEAATAPQACPSGCGLPNSIESSDGFNFIAKKFNSVRMIVREREHINDASPDGKLTRFRHKINTLKLKIHQQITHEIQ